MNADNCAKSALFFTAMGIIVLLFVALLYGPRPWLLLIVVWCVVMLLLYPFIYVHVCNIEFDPPEYLIRLS